MTGKTFEVINVIPEPSAGVQKKPDHGVVIETASREFHERREHEIQNFLALDLPFLNRLQHASFEGAADAL
jgi:hypothetical protein